MMSMWKRGLTLALCFLEITILGGALFGWPSLVYVLQADDLYIDRCLTKPNTVGFSARNGSLILEPSLDNATVNSVGFNSLGYVIDLSSITHSSTSNVSSDHDTFVSTGDVTTPSNYTMTVTAQPTLKCKEQEVALSLSYTIATVSFGVSALPIGLFFDRFGLRATRTIAVLLGVAGYCQLAFAKRGMEWPILTGAAFIGPTCYTLIVTNLHVVKLSGKGISSVTSIFAAGLNSSFAYQIVKMAHDAGVTRVVALLMLASLWLVVLFTSWCLLPKFKIDDKELGIGKHLIFAVFAMDLVTISYAKYSSNVRQAKNQNLLKYITSATYITAVFWFCADFTCHNMMLNGYNAWITEILHGDLNKVTFYTDFLAYGTLAGSLLTPVNGLITDFMLVKYGCGPGGKPLAILPAALFSSVIMALVNIPLLFQTETAIFAAGVLLLIGKPLFLSTSAIFLVIVPPMQYYGVLCGIMNLAGGVASFMVYPYLMWAAAAHSFIPVTILILASSILAFSFPLSLYYDRWTEVKRKEKRKNNRQQQQNTSQAQEMSTELTQNTQKLPLYNTKLLATVTLDGATCMSAPV